VAAQPADQFSPAIVARGVTTQGSDRRVVLTAVLADATNLGLTRMAEACSIASYRQLAWDIRRLHS
jgi:hypothetical protein